MNTARNVTTGTGATNTSAFAVGGEADPGSVANTEEWNGASWTEINDLNVAKQGLGGGRASNSPPAIVFGGSLNPGNITATEEWNTTSNTVKTLTD